jgi:hypothetical protein
MKAQDLFQAKGYQTSDNRSIEWRSINKALDYGIDIILVGVGKERTNKKGYNWKICLKYNTSENRFFQAYYKAQNLDHFVCGKWQSSSSGVVSSQVLSCILDFRQKLIDKGVFQTDIDFEKEPTMCKCSKCKGKGIIPAFMHISKGICFDCMGLGYGKQGKLSIL